MTGMTCASCRPGSSAGSTSSTGCGPRSTCRPPRVGHSAPAGTSSWTLRHRGREQTGYRADGPGRQHPISRRADEGPDLTRRPAALATSARLSSLPLAVPVLADRHGPADPTAGGAPLAGARADDPGHRLGRLAVPPGGRDQRPARRVHHGHPGLARCARRLRLVAVWSTWAAAAATSTSRSRLSSRLPARRPVPRGPGQGPPARRAAGAAGPRRQGGRSRIDPQSGHGENRIPVGELVGRRPVHRPPGEKVATDGVVLDGRSAVDARLVTGESMPVDVGPGDEVTGGLDQRDRPAGRRASRVGADTTLAADRPAGRAGADTARLRSSGSPTGCPASSCRSSSASRCSRFLACGSMTGTTWRGVTRRSPC